MKISVLILAVLLFSGGAANAQGERKKWAEPQLTDTPMVHDPVMAVEDGVYYLYSTGKGLKQMTSHDRKTWRIASHGALPAIPAWTHDSVPGFKSHVWAPDVIRYRARWWMAYSCSTFGKNTSAIGLISVDSLCHADGWRDEGALICSQRGRNNWNAIDPNFFIDRQGYPWLTFGSFWDGIQLVRLDSTMHVLQGCVPVTIARRHDPARPPEGTNPTSSYAGTNAIEAPFVFYRDGWYHLFVSWDYCCRGKQSTYRVVTGRSRTPDGPYVDRDNLPMEKGGGTLLIEGDKKEFEALGHCAVYRFGSDDLFVCHGYSIAYDGASVLVQRKINWTPDGWPVLGE